ncbi:MAG: hypothetical protein ACREJ2_06760 [Planctomycetota bacterium]
MPAENMHGIHSEPVTPHHHFAPVNSVRPANAPAEAEHEGLPHAADHDYTQIVGGFLIVTAVFVGLLMGNFLHSQRYPDPGATVEAGQHAPKP